jgi:hypothetical protein
LKLGKLGKLEAEATAAELRRRGGCIDVNFLSQVQKPPNRPMFSRADLSSVLRRANLR